MINLKLSKNELDKIERAERVVDMAIALAEKKIAEILGSPTTGRKSHIQKGKVIDLAIAIVPLLMLED